ncbi:MAG TPA: DNA repair protein RecN [Thermoanaerobaculia bacterium]|nr:DNA repair protein RecN [Thermoanaerobaculia bacterium]
MITWLKVANLAIVEELTMEPGEGLNVLTGETGAGKSLLIDSLEFLRGARGSTEMIRAGAEKMSAEAVFELPAGEMIVRREIAANGRGRVLVDGSVYAVRELSAAMDPVLEIHGQSDARERIAGQTFRELLDQYAGDDVLLACTGTAHREWRDAQAQLEQLSNAQRDRALRLDLLRYQIDEIAAAKLEAGEEAPLREERSMLAHAAEMIEATAGAFRAMEEDEDSALAQLGRAIHLLQPLAKEIEPVGNLSAELQEIIYRLQDTARTLSSLGESARHDPARLEAVEERLVTLERMRKKYGGSIEAAIAHLEASRAEFEQLRDYESNLSRLQAVEQETRAAYRSAAEALSAARKKAGREFESAIQGELHDLAMERTTVRVSVEPGSESESGSDRVEILVAPNRGEEPKPMQRIASGGELSRIQLAIAAALFKASPGAAGATLVFDEIDAGIGGRVAEVVGRKLQELAASNQVICVTHLPQIASFAAAHFFVWKEDAGGHTCARIRRLDDAEERVQEIARMLGGEKVPASAVLHARELLDGARRKPARART